MDVYDVHHNGQVASVRVDHLVHLSPLENDKSPLNVTFLPLPGEVTIENNVTVSVKEEDITEAVVKKVRDLLAAAQVDDTISDIIEDLSDQEVIIKVHTKEKPKNS